MEETVAAEPPPAPPRYGEFEVLRQEDGSLWELGRGAMGVTYKATDTILHRTVALKVIQLGVKDATDAKISDLLRERFLREARAAAALRHDHVAAVFHFGASAQADRCYYAMELVEGETLEAHVRRDGPLDVSSVLEVARQVCAALVAAAACGLVHRDLKPSNLMLTGSGGDTPAAGLEVKVIDFGLVKAAAVAGETDLTHGGFVGTPAFASPEQFARQAVDARSDLYSLGVTLWYALAGRAPFPGRTLEEVRDHPGRLRLPIEQLATNNVPTCVVALLRRVLAADPAERPASAKELLAMVEACGSQLDLLQGASAAADDPRPAGKLRALERKLPWRGLLVLAAIAVLLLVACLAFFLRRLTPAHGSDSDRGVAVIPLVNVGGDPSNEYFSDGLSEELIAVLAKIPDLKVIGRGSSFTFKGKPDDSAVIGQKLGVAQLVEGSVRRQGDRVRIVADLIRAWDGQQLWSETYDRELKDIFAVQSEIAQAIAAQLKLKLLGGTDAAAPPASAQHLAAYDAVLQAKFHLRKASGVECQQAIKYAEEATTLEPNYAAAWAWLSAGWRRWAASYDTGDNAPAYAKARAFADKALRLDPNSYEAFTALWGIAITGDFDFERAEMYARRALERAPGDVPAKIGLGDTYLAQGKLEEAEKVGHEVVALDPLQNTSWYQMGLIVLARGRTQEAERYFRKALELEPRSSRVHSRLVALAILHHEATRALEEAGNESEGFWRNYAIALALQAGDDRGKADAALQGMIDRYSQNGSYQIAELYAVQGQADAMFRWLDKAYENHDGGLTQLLSDPFITSYRDDARLAAFCRKLKIELPTTNR